MLRSWNSQFKIWICEHFIYKTEFAILENGKLVTITYIFVWSHHNNLDNLCNGRCHAGVLVHKLNGRLLVVCGGQLNLKWRKSKLNKKLHDIDWTIQRFLAKKATSNPDKKQVAIWIRQKATNVMNRNIALNRKQVESEEFLRKCIDHNKQNCQMWHDQGKWVTCRKFQFQFSYTTFS